MGWPSIHSLALSAYLCVYCTCVLTCALPGVSLQIIESRLKLVLSEDLGGSLMDGVVLCHLVNHIRPRSVASIHVPSPAVVSQRAHLPRTYPGGPS